MRRSTVSITVLLILTVVVIASVPQVPLLVFAGVLISVFLSGGGAWVGRVTRMGRKLGLLSFSAFLGLLIVLFFNRAAQGLAAQFIQLLDQIPAALDRLEALLTQNQWAREIWQRMDIEGMIPSGMGAISTVQSTAGFLGNTFLVLFIGIYCAITPGIYRQGFVLLVEPDLRPRLSAMLVDAGAALRSWLTAQFGSMAVIGVLTWMGLTALGVPLALILAVLAAVATFIPNIGPVLAAVPAVLMSLSLGLNTAALTLGLYVLVQAIESYLVTPKLQQEVVQLPPALTISFQLLMGYLFGLLGFALATPFLAVVVTIVRKHYIRDYLEGAQAPSTSSSP